MQAAMLCAVMRFLSLAHALLEFGCRRRHSHLCRQRATLETCRVAVLQAGQKVVHLEGHDAFDTAPEFAAAV